MLTQRIVDIAQFQRRGHMKFTLETYLENLSRAHRLLYCCTFITAHKVQYVRKFY